MDVAKRFPKSPAWVGAVNESGSGVVGGGEWSWKENGTPKVMSDFFEEGEMHDGDAFGAFQLPDAMRPGDDGTYPKGGMVSMPSFDWRVRGLIVEYTPGFSSSYTLNGWAMADHPAMQTNESEQFYRTLDEGGSELPLFSEGTGPRVMPRTGDGAPDSVMQGGQSGEGLDRLAIDRYRNGRNHVAFADGSVRSVLLEDLWKLKWHRDWQTPNTRPRLPQD